MVLSIIFVLVALFVAWVIASVPLYLAAKVVARQHATFGRAMAATVLGPVLMYLFLFVFTFVFLPLSGSILFAVIAFIVAVVVLSWVYAAIFRTSLLGGVGIAIIAAIISLIIIAIFAGFFAILPFSGSLFHPMLNRGGIPLIFRIIA